MWFCVVFMTHTGCFTGRQCERDRQGKRKGMCEGEREVMMVWKSLMSVCLFQKAGNSPRLCLVNSTFTKVAI